MARRGGASLAALVGLACLWPAAALRRALAGPGAAGLYARGAEDNDLAVERPTRAPRKLAKSTLARQGLAVEKPTRAPRKLATSTLAREGKSVVDAWILMAHGQMSLERNMYTPLLLPLEDSLQSVGAVTRVIDQSSVDDMLAGVKESRALHRTPLVVAVAVHKASNATSQAIMQCVDEGAYLAIYSTEPAKAKRVVELAQMYRAGEIWEYSLSNVGRYHDFLQAPLPVRYIPPAYSPRLVVNGSLLHKSRTEDKLAFLGGLNGRPKRIQDMLKRALGGSLFTTVKVWNDKELRSFINKYPLQLNVHKSQTCCPHDENEPVAMEAFRLASLLSNAACVISTPAPALDEPEWRDIVHFAEVNKILETFEDLQDDVIACQKEGKRRFMERFNATRLLNASGLLNVWWPGHLMPPRGPPRSS